jgi:phosphomannomutase
MPEVSRFYGIIIRMYFADHNPPHFHAYYGADSVEIDIQRAAVMAGQMPTRALGMVLEWAALHRDELLEIFALAQNNQTIHKIDPLP